MMSRQTRYIVQAFKAGARGKLIAEPQIGARSAENAIMRAEKLAPTRAGVMAYSIESDPEMGDFDEPKVLFRAGTVPEME
jgi:hypothetical protein